MDQKELMALRFEVTLKKAGRVFSETVDIRKLVRVMELFKPIDPVEEVMAMREGKTVILTNQQNEILTIQRLMGGNGQKKPN